MIKALSIRTQFGWITAYEQNNRINQIKFGRIKKQKHSKTLNKFKKYLLQFTHNKKVNVKISCEMNGNVSQKKVWNELKKIKKGKTKTYGQIAKKCRLSPRYVGKICGQNNLLIYVPCHRVVKSDGTIGGFSSLGGVKLKKKLLKFESLQW